MKTSNIVGPIVFWFGMFLGAHVGAQDSSAKDPYSGEFWSRSTLTGDWGGLRSELAAKGVTLDMSITQVGQGVVNGGKNGAWEYGGRGDFILNLDSGKLGLWPGGFFNFEMEGNWASSVNPKTGALMPVNSNQQYPLPPGGIFGVPAWNFTQYPSSYLGLTIGKFATITANSGDMNEFAHGKGDSNFMNMAFTFNPLTAFTTPYSTLGTGLLLSPSKDPNESLVSFFVMSANGNPATSGFENLNGNAVIVSGEGQVRTEFFGLTGHQLFGTTFSNKKFSSIDQRFDRDTIENGTLRAKKGSWNIYYNFDQYLYEPKKGLGRGVGVFTRLGVSDGNPNFMKFFASFGIGGKAMFERRPNDKFGLGYYFMNMHNPTIQGPLQTTKLLRDEYGFEAFYTFAITPWALLTPDIQIVRGAQKDKVTIGQGPLGLLPRLNRKSIGMGTTLGLRFQLVF